MMHERHAGRSPRVLVVFADATIGGTSRSALLAGRGWASVGADVTWLPLEGIAPHRQAAFEKVGPSVGLGEVDWTGLDVVHLHHGAVAGLLEGKLAPLVAAHSASNRHLPLITHNIFGEPHGVLDNWRGRVLVNVLGPWCREQLRASLWPRPLPVVEVLPNPQDLAFFRLPTDAERQRARARFGIATEEVLLGRSGSPIEQKWSRAYVDVAHGLRDDQRLLLLGAPRSLEAALVDAPRVEMLDPVGDEVLRDFYWACDAFILAADQGESFGNVILEALGCGAPVHYLSRPFRDNTPWDFQGVPGFTLHPDRRAWVDASLTAGPRPDLDEGGAWRSWFSVESVGRALRSQLDWLAGRRASPEGTGWPERGVTPRQRLQIAARHNRVLFTARSLWRHLKRWRVGR